MSALDDLKEYCYALQELRAIEQQIERIGISGAPVGIRPIGGGAPGTNDHAAAVLQQQDGLEAILEKKRVELEEKVMRGERALEMVTYPRARVILRRFYVLGCSDARIAEELGICKKTVQRVRVAAERELDLAESSGAVSGCP